ncbi:lamin tail domain-containing protein [Pilimelia columellifera]|uniref:LTD domain-containing protein n=1 Tax=Pilimelia columellifera subsp. columellifera TaxID=706583 RepID=A0ABP6AE51_9ACTN
MRLRTLLASAVALVAALGGLAAPAPASAAAPVIMITKIWYDSPGTDRGANASLNAEYVQLRNTTRTRRSLTGWTVRDTARHVYTFGTFNLNAGATVTLRTGIGTNTATNRYWGRRAYVWNNDRDTAILRNASGVQIDSCAYNSTRYDYRNC